MIDNCPIPTTRMERVVSIFLPDKDPLPSTA